MLIDHEIGTTAGKLTPAMGLTEVELLSGKSISDWVCRPTVTLLLLQVYCRVIIMVSDHLLQSRCHTYYESAASLLCTGN